MQYTLLFGFISGRWCIFRRPIILEPSQIGVYVKAALALHNNLRIEESAVIVHLSLLMGKTGMVIILMVGGGQTVILVVV